LNVVDECTRECPAIVVDRHIDADRVGSLLEPKSSSRTCASTTAWNLIAKLVRLGCVLDQLSQLRRRIKAELRPEQRSEALELTDSQ
jgi:hypothetical protein